MLTADLLKRLREALRHCLEIASICILASLAVLVIVGVISRKAGYSLAWYDEVASILLAWLTYYGTALAALHRAHLSLPGFVNRTHGGLRTVLIAFKGLTVASFFLLTAWMGVKLLGVLGGTTPGKSSMAAIASGLLGHPTWSSLVSGRRTSKHHRRVVANKIGMTLFLVFLGLIALIFANIPIAVALGVVSVVAILLETGVRDLPNVPLTLFDGAVKFTLIAVPLFILAGAIMNASGISRRLIALTSSLIGFVRGGLSMVTIGSSLFFAEISGSAVADVAALGAVLIPAMKRTGYTREFAAAVTSSAFNTCCHHSSVHPDDPLRGHGRNVNCRAIPGRRHSWPAGWVAHDVCCVPDFCQE